MVNIKEIIKVLEIERECVSRDCDRNCGSCDLVQEREWLLSIYDSAIELLKEQEKLDNHRQRLCPNCLNSEIRWDSSEDMSDIGCSEPGVADFYHCENCGASIEIYVPEKNEIN
jgi:hypothetical protein